ncbi:MULTISPECIES: hypothetical protein [unclassified Mesorhizobium]|uniref:hypothetical protein n=1 Tax=unclassified Mesorhizobium TaxID=325217 RepID=UPI000FD60F41|nr:MULTISPECIES: hypothetical protein [unclassified Mesorhizobium]RUV83428.1 hypothetical protein EOA88_17680 [Mesorhizobium sp. M5C.F.Ca.IN.020.14.1.1]RUV15599.1 hypothetical protein EOA86_31315 [Mesorhizobium sp. M5C.F.Ca.IN.020.32.2.1]RWG48261.1 MAG: hypothetical protein EOQ62_09985 [Mesorhizobium sp.]RWH44740.1 MAG: hypothetical protein EOQ80_20650 [Mesorhizobium sp.]RWH53127.1 MAG: hypothetical protein EOQ82_24030 [Mesorhizobium sp.]
MAVRIKLPGGTLKMKVYRELRERERTRRIPVLKVGSVYFSWWSNRQRPLDDPPGTPDDPDQFSATP